MNKVCDFCRSEETPENKIIKGEEHTICRSCAETALYLIELENDSEEFINNPVIKETETEKLEVLTPKDYKLLLDKYVIGQTDAKKVLSVAIYNHIKRIENPTIKIEKSNVLFIGNTGTGKTYLAETIAKHLDIPLAIVNTTSLTAAGYIGEDVASVLERLWKDAGQDVKKAENGIIFLDEIDKNATSVGGTNNKDVSGKAVQQELLKILEGDIVKIYPEGSDKNRKAGTPIEINTKNILFIAGGAFVGLKDKPGVRMNALGVAGKDKKETPSTEMLVDYGMIYEFIGRFKSIVELEDLDIKALKRILVEPKNSILQSYKNLFSLSNININFSDSYINKVANESIILKTGARSLGNILEKDLIDLMFNVDEPCNITVDYKYNKVKILTTAL